MRRREVVAGLGVAAAWPLTAEAQQPAPRVIGVLGSASPGQWVDRLRAFREGLGDAGYIEGKNVALEYRWADGRNDRLLALAAELVRHPAAVIVVLGNTSSAIAAKAATVTVPVVFRLAVDPVELGLVPSLSRPGGNITGVTTLGVEVGPKQLELLRELIPAANVVALLTNPTNPAVAEIQSRDLRAAARALGLQLHVANASSESEFDAVFAALTELRTDGLVIGADAFFNRRNERLAGVGTPQRNPNDLSLSRVRRGGRPDELRRQHHRRVATGRRLCRPNSQRRKASRASGPAGGKR